MATFEVNEYDIDINSKRLVSKNAGGYPLDDTDKPRLYFNEKVVWALNCYDRDLATASFAGTDTWELYCDVDFDHDLYTGSLNAALTTAAATTQIVINYATAPTTASPIPATGGVLLRDDSGNRERVAYTAVSNPYTTQVTYTCNVTLTYPYATGDYAAQEDPLMVSVSDSDFNVAGDWASLDVANGKISAKVDCTNWEFSRKVQAYITANPSANEVPIWVQINKYASGQSTPSVILQDTIYAKPSVRDIENAAAIGGPIWTLPDARYLQVYSLTSTATGALVDTDQINVFDAGTSGVVKTPLSAVGTWIGGTYMKLTQNYTTGTQASLIDADEMVFYDNTSGNEHKTTMGEVKTYVKQSILSTASTATTYTPALTIIGRTINFTGGTGVDVTIPSSTSINFAVGDQFEILNGGGICSVVGENTGVTINNQTTTGKTVDTWGVARLIKYAANGWSLSGNFSTT